MTRPHFLFCLILGFVCTVMLSANVLAEEIILHDNALDRVVDDDFALSSTRGPGYHCQAADDFGLSEDLPINRIIWKGTWVEEGEVETFRFLFYHDRGDGKAPTGGSGDPTSTAVVMREVTFTEAHQGARMENGMAYYYADFFPGIELDQETCWLAIQAKHTSHVPGWGWTMISWDIISAHIGEPAVWGTDNQYWQFPNTPPPTLQFRLVHIEPIPEPCALILLTTGACGLLAYGWRKRRQ
ncbi:MAG: hypothetical protein JXB10_10685 [Pirellulales bacterium]|nr:hypothetical protein [Pirellulales bacterium]